MRTPLFVRDFRAEIFEVLEFDDVDAEVDLVEKSLLIAVVESSSTLLLIVSSESFILISSELSVLCRLSSEESAEFLRNEVVLSELVEALLSGDREEDCRD